MAELFDGWLLLVHQLPASPAYLRVKTWRRLQALGAVALKGSVYALPASAQTLEDFQWLLKEIQADGGEAMLCEARLIDGLDDEAAQALFTAPREADYRALKGELETLAGDLPDGSLAGWDGASELKAGLAKARKRLAGIGGIDFFGAPGREAAESLLAELERRLLAEAAPRPAEPRSEYEGRTWVTRRSVHVDRIACAWLIGRFIDPKPRFKFVEAKPAYVPEAGELRFDMFEAEFTHVGEDCSFETFLNRLGLGDPALRAIAEIIHDIDLKDGKFGRDETAGVAHLLDGLAQPRRTDEERIARGSVLLDSLYEYFSGQS